MFGRYNYGCWGPVDVGGVLEQRTIYLGTIRFVPFSTKALNRQSSKLKFTFDPKQNWNQITPCLNYYQYHLKGISLLPDMIMKIPTMPTTIDEKTYEKVKKLANYLSVWLKMKIEIEQFCNNSCEVIPMTIDNDDQDYWTKYRRKGDR